jgi:hypothetical protein
MVMTTRRRFVQTAAGFAAALFAARSGSAGPARRRTFRIYRWSGRGRRVSQAALSHAANRRYLTKRAALRDLPHPNANLRLVPLASSLSEILRLFVKRRRLVADLRSV